MQLKIGKQPIYIHRILYEFNIKVSYRILYEFNIKIIYIDMLIYYILNPYVIEMCSPIDLNAEYPIIILTMLDHTFGGCCMQLLLSKP
ncbi:Os05g0214100 [Oryza sativa Japonica Group]|jgi:hypothetical protein|uniref:Os05g0214100 protein n=1 Tax=Oryza sativa subsp. japonica TaxID=39947 RepID=A0A0P0WJA5_ORYSJ|nr:hypothetical protein EE612_027869 [Oryza sativa]BAS92821.1 Os05g0214100 [Oryza sativa Japonica Group]